LSLPSTIKACITHWRTKAEQKVFALIAPLGKLGRFEEVAKKISQVDLL